MSKVRESREYVIRGPFGVQVLNPKRCWYKLSDDVATSFFRDNSIEHYSSKIGVYVFARKHGRTYLPIYVGKSVNSFGAEIFNDSNRLTYNDAVMENNGKFFVFLIIPTDIEGCNNWNVADRTVSQRRSDEIDNIETFFIQKAAKANPKLKNKQKRKTPEWHIAGLVRKKKRGIKESSLSEFKKMMKM